MGLLGGTVSVEEGSERFGTYRRQGINEFVSFLVTRLPIRLRGGGGNGSLNTTTEDGGWCGRLRLDFWKGMRVLGQVLRSTWWEWTHGSAPIFWRWNGWEQITAARDGMTTFVRSSLPRSNKGVKRLRFDTETRKLVSSKIETMISNSYLEIGFVRTSLHFFAVPKGEDDIRVVFDGTSCGLNEALWSPNFFLPTSRNAAEMLSFDTWMSDADLGEFFHNFFADEKVRKHSGVKNGWNEWRLQVQRPQMGKIVNGEQTQPIQCCSVLLLG